MNDYTTNRKPSPPIFTNHDLHSALNDLDVAGNASPSYDSTDILHHIPRQHSYLGDILATKHDYTVWVHVEVFSVSLPP